MTTANDIISLAFANSGVMGVGQIPLAEDTNRALQLLNYMIAGWNRKRWLIWHLVDLSLQSTGAQSYSVGPGGDFNIGLRPDRLEDAYLVQNVNGGLPVSYPLKLLQAREDYDRIALKTLTSFSYSIFYDSAFPLGFAFPWPIPTAALYTLHLIVKDVLTQFANLTTVLATTDEYADAMVWNLTRRLRAAYRLPADPEITAFAKEALNTLRKANTQVPQLRMPVDLLRPGYYNIYADTNY